MHATPATVRELMPADLANGFLETLESLTEVGLTPAEAEAIRNSPLRAGVHTFVAEVEGRVVATASLVVEQKFIHSGGRIGHVEDVAVHRGYQKRGLGQAVVRHALAEADRLGCYKVILNCYDDLVPFYAAIGFRRQDNGMRIDLPPRAPAD